MTPQKLPRHDWLIPEVALDLSSAGSRPGRRERRLAALEIADQVAKSRWLRIQCVNHVFALTLTLETAHLAVGKVRWVSSTPRRR
jgi:hypothetical protein